MEMGRSKHAGSVHFENSVCSKLYLHLSPDTKKQYDSYKLFEQYHRDSSCIYESKGMKWILKGLLYYDFANIQNVNSTDVGINTPKMENNSPVVSHNLLRVSEKRWNDSIESRY